MVGAISTAVYFMFLFVTREEIKGDSKEKALNLVHGFVRAHTNTHAYPHTPN